MSDSVELPGAPGLASEVVGQVVAELGRRRGDKVLRCLRTAAALLSQAREDGSEGLRLAESAAYNLREAFDAVVGDQRAVEGGIGEVIAAWNRYEVAVQGPGSDVVAARAELDGVLSRCAQDEERQGLRARQLLDYVRSQTGVEPLRGDRDPTEQYRKLRGRAASLLHSDATVAGVSALYDEAIAWFDRFFTPPDGRVRAIVALAERPYAANLIDEARDLVLNGHHLRLLLSRRQDPEWLGPLYDAGLIPLPRAGEPWPVMALVGGDRAIDRRRIADVLQRMLAGSKRQSKPRRIEIAREIITCASRLGAAGHPVGQEVIAKYPDDHWVQLVAVAIAKAADATEPIQLAVADAIVEHERWSDRGYHTRIVLERLADGLTEGNVAERMMMVAAKIRRLATPDRMRFIVLDTVALHADGDELREPVLIAAHYFTTMIPRARDVGLPTRDILAMVDRIPGELGERIVCQVLAGVSDVDREVKLAHVECRMASEVATGDDRDLINDILTAPLSPDEVQRWRAKFGQPSPAPEPDGVGADWLRAWRWSVVLPSEVLKGWETAIAAVTARHGEPTPSSLDTRVSQFMRATGQSPYSHSEIASLPVADAAALVADWRPRADDDWGVSARELARALEAAVTENLGDWIEDPTMVVTTLREPVYIDYYFRALKQCAADLGDRASAVLTAVRLVQAHPWEPTPLGRDDYEYEPDWSGVDSATVDLIAALANHEGDLAADLDLCWDQATEMVRRLPGSRPDLTVHEGDESRIDAPLNRAINQPYGRALEAALALGAWEHRNQGTASARLTEILDEVLAVPGSVGLELRAILAHRRRLLEAIALEWLEANADTLFGTDPLGVATFDQTLTWSRPSSWFYGRYQAELVAAARRGVGEAVSWLLLAVLWDASGYTLQTVVEGLRGNTQALKAAGERMAGLLQDAAADDPMLDRGLAFWDDMLKADRKVVPAGALVGLGRWAFVDGLDDERFLELMDRTVSITGGETDMAIEVADRCRKAQPSSRGLRILRTMIGHGERWEQHHTETSGVEALQIAASRPVDEEFDRLRTRLIERGHHEAADISPAR